MLNLKKTAVAVLAFGSSAVFAGSMGPVCSAVNVTVPCETTAWDFGAKALYMKPSVDSNQGEFGPLANHNPNYNWGFQIEGSYHFNTGNDLDINWYHLSKSSTKYTGASAPIVVPFTASIYDTITPVSGAASVDPRWDMVNIEVGQHVDFGDNKAIRFHGGAEYARLANKASLSAVNDVASTVGATTTTAVSSIYSTYSPTYNGFGPRLGADMSYDWGNGLGIYANGATAILAGSSAYSASLTNVATGTSYSVSHSRTQIVPELDAKLGATYTYAMAQGDLTLDAGWMFVNYFNVHRTVEGTTNDFGLQGPFIGLKWLGNVV